MCKKCCFYEFTTDFESDLHEYLTKWPRSFFRYHNQLS